jgi:hypothetical protein
MPDTAPTTTPATAEHKEKDPPKPEPTKAEQTKEKAEPKEKEPPAAPAPKKKAATGSESSDSSDSDSDDDDEKDPGKKKEKKKAKKAAHASAKASGKPKSDAGEFACFQSCVRQEPRYWLAMIFSRKAPSQETRPKQACQSSWYVHPISWPLLTQTHIHHIATRHHYRIPSDDGIFSQTESRH